MIIKEDKALNQQLDKQIKAELIVESKLRYVGLCFYKERQIITIGIRLQKIKPTYNKR